MSYLNRRIRMFLSGEPTCILDEVCENTETRYAAWGRAGEEAEIASMLHLAALQAERAKRPILPAQFRGDDPEDLRCDESAKRYIECAVRLLRGKRALRPIRILRFAAHAAYRSSDRLYKECYR